MLRYGGLGQAGLYPGEAGCMSSLREMVSPSVLPGFASWVLESRGLGYASWAVMPAFVT